MGGKSLQALHMAGCSSLPLFCPGMTAWCGGLFVTFSVVQGAWPGHSMAALHSCFPLFCQVFHASPGVQAAVPFSTDGQLLGRLDLDLAGSIVYVTSCQVTSSPVWPALSATKEALGAFP